MSDEISQINGELDEVTRARIQELKGFLKDLEKEKIPFMQELRTSAVSLANGYAFQIKTLETGIDPDKYKRLGQVAHNAPSYNFGEHPNDLRAPSYSIDWNNKLVADNNYDNLWRLADQPDYVRPPKP